MQDVRLWFWRWVLLTSVRLEGAFDGSFKKVAVTNLHTFHFEN
jgi:hypothetical protein